MSISNLLIQTRLDELIAEGESILAESNKPTPLPGDSVRFTRWTTTCLNLLDKLSISTNRFVTEFEYKPTLAIIPSETSRSALW